MASVVLDGVSKVFGGDVLAVNRVSLEIRDGEFMVLVGPSGCGKSTILRIVAGLEEVTAGEVRIGERDVTDLPPKERDVAMVFQNYALYPHMTVEENIGFGLRLQGKPKEDVRAAVAEAARILGLDALLARKPAELSGGQRQRVAMGRAIVREPRVLLMDEPLSNLDAKLRVQMRANLAQLHDRLGTTTVYVTHDQVEAMTLGERVAVLRDGILQQVDTPQDLYRRPANVFVAAFMGSPPMNLVEATVRDGAVAFGPYAIPLPDPGRRTFPSGGRIVLGIRPPDFEDAAIRPDTSLPTIEATALVTEELGSEVHVLFEVDAPPVVIEELVEGDDSGEAEAVATLGTGRAVFCARVDPRTATRPGDRVRLTVDPARFHFFDPATGAAIAAG
ncbi:MAG: ABC transporter ATP-binding protein [Actinomycetota bacterium]